MINGQGVDLQTTFAFNTRSNASFTKVHGSITLTGFLNLHGVLTCVHVAHNHGTAGYRIVAGQNAGQGFVAAAKAGTESSGGRILWYDFLPKAPSKCPPSTAHPTGAVPGAPLSSGYDHPSARPNRALSRKTKIGREANVLTLGNPHAWGRIWTRFVRRMAVADDA